MGLLDGVLGNVLSGMLSGGAPAGQQQQQPTGGQAGGFGTAQLIQIALQLIQQSGRLPALLDRFRKAGLGAQADSWVSTGANHAITPDQVGHVLGSDTIGQIAGQLGLGHAEVSSGLASVLPGLIDKLTPSGQVADDHGDVISQALGMLLGGSGQSGRS
jgi:uncharacterized protein YidB (DUF937 family)